MSLNDLNKLTGLQWELSNPLYYPDDSAPPVPNLAIHSVEENSLPFNNTQDSISLANSGEASTSMTDLYNFTGVPNTSDFHYGSGMTNVTADHVFYSHLNVDTILPPYFVTPYDGSIEGYFRDLIPAMCGLYNVEVPVGGTHLGYYANPSYGNEDRFGVSSSGEAMHTVHGTLSRGSVNMSKDPVRDVDIIDFVFHMSDASPTDIAARTADITIYSDQFNIRIRYTGRKQYSPTTFNQTFRVFFQDNIEDSTEVEVITNFTTYNIDLNKPQVVRVDLANGLIEVISQQLDGQSQRRSNTFSFSNPRPQIRITEINGGFNSHTNYTMQIIGYRDFDALPLSEQYEEVLFYKKYYYPLLDIESIQDEMEYRLLPRYSGNAWDYINKLGAIFPFRRLV